MFLNKKLSRLIYNMYIHLYLICYSGTDDDDTILKSFDAFEINGKIDAEM